LLVHQGGEKIQEDSEKTALQRAMPDNKEKKLGRKDQRCEKTKLLMKKGGGFKGRKGKQKGAERGQPQSSKEI